jgi:hypothetical protein
MGTGGGRETGKNGKHRGTEGTEKRGRKEEKGGEEREEKRSEPNAFSLRVSLLDLANLAPLR